ncbi:MAG: phosphoribosylanthranilate isomerase [Proteobacteria bacterium]|nr:phosphoribosylanthranilate isomerase [Pseudomonadota bacterium]
MNIRVKICGITRRRDALDACAAGADLLGFNFVPQSRRYLNPYAARDIIASLPPFVLSVGIFANEDPRVINDLSSFLHLNAVQLHGDEDPSCCRKMDLPVIKAVRVASEEDIRDLERFDVAALLLDSKVSGALGGSGVVFPWHLATKLCESRRVFIAGGMSPENVAEAIKTLGPFGVDAASGVETGPGIKDRALMESFIQAARRAAAQSGGKSVHIG